MSFYGLLTAIFSAMTTFHTSVLLPSGRNGTSVDKQLTEGSPSGDQIRLHYLGVAE